MSATNSSVAHFDAKLLHALLLVGSHLAARHGLLLLLASKEHVAVRVLGIEDHLRCSIRGLLLGLCKLRVELVRLLNLYRT